MTNVDLMDKIEDLIDEYFDENPTEQCISETYEVGRMSIRFEVEKW